MSSDLPRLFLARHGATAWTESRQHTGRTDLPLNERGEERARQIGERLRRFSFARVFSSPLQRATKTCELAGFGAAAEVDPDLVEWDYGRYEGQLTRDISKERPDWEMFRDGCPDGESPHDVAVRADRFIARVRGMEGDILAFSSGHIIRMIAARWLGLPPGAGRFFFGRPASVGLKPELAELAAKGHRRMSDNPHANGGLLLRDLKMPDFRSYAGACRAPRRTSRRGGGAVADVGSTGWCGTTAASRGSGPPAPRRSWTTSWATSARPR